MSTEGRRYRILGVLGKGGFGTVYRAELLGEGGFVRQVALKCLNANMEGQKDVARRLRDEARVLGMLRHRAILQVDGLVRLDDRWTVVMEYVAGVDLQKLTRDHPMPPGPALEVVGEVAGALHVAWSWPGPDGQPLKLLHRDIKPANILLTAVGEVKVLDFGIARANFAGREAMTKSVIFGSPGYMAPERLDFEELPAGDVYSAGVVLYELMSGTAFGKATARVDKHRQMIDDASGKLRARGVPEDVVALVGRMLSHDPEKRPTARDVENACRDLRGRVGGPWLRDWAEQHVPPALAERDEPSGDELSGQILAERSTSSSLDTGSETMGFGREASEEAPRPVPAPVGAGGLAVPASPPVGAGGLAGPAGPPVGAGDPAVPASPMPGRALATFDGADFQDDEPAPKPTSSAPSAQPTRPSPPPPPPHVRSVTPAPSPHRAASEAAGGHDRGASPDRPASEAAGGHERGASLARPPATTSPSTSSSTSTVLSVLGLVAIPLAIVGGLGALILCCGFLSSLSQP